VKFNNEFFASFFSVGAKFIGLDQYTVPFEAQSPQISHAGMINLIDTLAPIPDKLSAKEWDGLEACLLIEHIQKIKKEFPQEKICLLYRNLNPVKVLIK